MTDLTELRRKAKEYDNLYNEGGEGYNPFWQQIEQAEFDAAQSAPRTKSNVTDDLLKAQNYLSYLRRECFSSDDHPDIVEAQSKIAALAVEEKAFEAAENAEFFTEWTAEVTTARRLEWNNFIQENEGEKTIGAMAMRWQWARGWYLESLKKAIKHYHVPAKKS